MSAQGVDTSARPADVAQEQLEHGGGADDLCAEAVLRPADRINNGRYLFQVTVLAHRREQVCRFEKLVFGDSRDALHHLRCVAGIMLLQHPVDATWVFEREIVIDTRGHPGENGRLALTLHHGHWGL